MEQESGWDKPRRLVVTLPNGTTKTIGISQGSSKRYWFGICPISFKIGNLKMCGGCQVVGYLNECRVFFGYVLECVLVLQAEQKFGLQTGEKDICY